MSLFHVATYGALSPAHGIALNRGSPSGRAIIDRQTIHIHDLAEEIETEFPEVAEFRSVWAIALRWRRRCCGKVFPLGRF